MSYRFASSCIAPILAISICAWTLTGAEPASDSPGAAAPVTDASIYGQGVRSTDWLAPEDERAGFHLPPGFEVRLFAAEPEIAKPLNMAFDSRGRMWVTNSVEYPYAAKEGEVRRDAVTILEDIDGDGRADKVTTFADELNIPIGILPYGDGCICFSIPNIWYFRDTDGDGRCDKREVVLGPFDTSRDTHGLINSFRDGGDGWIYACHGFNNQSEVAGTDGHLVRLQSGNTFRFRPDGSRIEQVTHGQVNPFGMTVDEWGYRYTADCHSKPITQLIPGACYPSFGRPHDGLGFLPPMVDHLHGSTAICGIVYVPTSSPIVPLRSQMISGNVMTSRLNRNEVYFNGATAKGRELSDFMTSNDPWFRPVDIQLGPDGNLYVADFYNKIIGHYEVRLDHPERDRTSGRI
jgi:glucose/arabinose dehydrogenase